jgi:hypothetical protein
VPAESLAGGPGLLLRVHGSDFAADSLVRWNGTVRRTRFVNESQLLAFIPARDLARPGTVQVVVANPGRPGNASNAVSFTIRPRGRGKRSPRDVEAWSPEARRPRRSRSRSEPLR